MTGGSNIASLKTALAAAAKVLDAEAEIAFLKLTIEKRRRDRHYGDEAVWPATL